MIIYERPIYNLVGANEHGEVKMTPLTENMQVLTKCPDCGTLFILEQWEFGKHLASEDFCLSSSRILCGDCSARRLEQSSEAEKTPEFELSSGCSEVEVQ